MAKREELCRAVESIAWGYNLIHLDVNIGTLNILPDWLGYLLLLGVLSVLEKEVKTAALLRPLGILLVLWNSILWLTTLFGISFEPYLLTTLALVIDLYFHFQLLTDLAELAERRKCPEKKSILTLRTVRTVMITFSALPLQWQEIEALGIVVVLVQVVVALWICVVLFELKRSLAVAAWD